MKKLFITLPCLLSGFVFLFSADKIGELKSPNGKIAIELSRESDGSVFYSVSQNNALVVKDSKLDIKTNRQALSECVFEKSEYKTINETFHLLSGKVHNYTNHYNELTASFKHTKSDIIVDFRAFNDGVAFRYKVIDEEASSVSVKSETSEININNYKKSWAQKYTLPAEDYSEYYIRWEDWTKLAEQRSLFAPVLTEDANKNYILLTEADNHENYATSKFMAADEEGHFYLEKRGAIQSTLPLSTPWRVIMLGDLPTIMQSTIVENLNPPTTLTDLSWIKPGRVSWSWGGEDASAEAASDFTIIKKYIDLAHNMNWEYCLLDEGWESSKVNYTLQDAIQYADSKNVGLFVWSGSGRFPNDEAGIRNILKPWKEKGVKGIKLDFFNSDKQDMMSKYEKLYKVSAELKLILNLHGCTKPSGRVRTWPHLLTTEAVYGGENYLHNSTVTPANHNIILTMTRGVLGSMDYTPGDFGTKNGQVRQLTTWAHQMALLTAYESGLQHFVDCPENYNYHIGEGFFKILPTTWDDFKVFEADPEEYVSLGRKKGDDWYIATLSKGARTMNLQLDFLESGKKYYAYIYKDGKCKTDIAFEYLQDITNTSSLSINVKATGGATIHISTSPDFFKPEVAIYEAESPVNATSNVSTWTDDKNLCSGNKFVGSIGMGRNMAFKKIFAPTAGRYAITFFYMTGEKRDAYIKINGSDASIKQLVFNATESYDGKGLGTKTIVVDLQQGDNTIEFGNKTGHAPNLDRIAVQQALKKDDEGAGMVINKEPEISVENIRDGVRVVCNGEFKYQIFSISGCVLAKGSNFGDTFIPVEHKGISLIQVSTSDQELTRKIIIE